jgi:DNA-binding transcriptional MerR regulator
LRQLQWWDEQGVVTPMQKGRRRLYNSSEVLLVGIIVKLRQKKLSLQKIRRVVDALKGDESIPKLVVGTTPSDVFLLTDGDRVSMHDSTKEIVYIQATAISAMHVVNVSEILSDFGWAEEGTPRKPVHVETSSSGSTSLPGAAASKVS